VSKQNVEVARRLRDSLLAGDAESAAALVHPEAELRLMLGRFRGEEGMDAWYRDATAYLVDYEPGEVEFIDGGDAVVVAMELKPRGAHTALASQELIYLLRFREGKVTSVSSHATRAEALEAAGAPGGEG
jgi:ketosteroid isomerase-like protein